MERIWQAEASGQQAPPLPPLSAVAEAKTDSFLASLVEPQWGQGVPFQFVDRTSTSLSFRQFAQ